MEAVTFEEELSEIEPARVICEVESVPREGDDVELESVQDKDEVLTEPTLTLQSSHPCTQCEKRFTASSSLRRHQKVHTGVTIYVCSDCGRKLTSLGNSGGT